MDEHLPEPPPLPRVMVESLTAWLDHVAEWLVADHEAARLRGHSISPDSLSQLRTYEDAALLLREAYDLPMSRGD